MEKTYTIPELIHHLQQQYQETITAYYLRQALDVVEGRGAKVQRVGRIRVITPSTAKAVERELLDRGHLRKTA